MDKNALRMMVLNATDASIAKAWQFRVEVDNLDLPGVDLYIADISYGPTELSTLEKRIGAMVLTFPESAQPVRITLTMRDTEKREISKWFDRCCAGVVNSDGTVNLPYGDNGWMRKVRIYSFAQAGDDPDDFREELLHEWEMLPIQRGDVTQSVKESGFLEFPCTLVQFQSI